MAQVSSVYMSHPNAGLRHDSRIAKLSLLFQVVYFKSLSPARGFDGEVA